MNFNTFGKVISVFIISSLVFFYFKTNSNDSINNTQDTFNNSSSEPETKGISTQLLDNQTTSPSTIENGPEAQDTSFSDSSDCDPNYTPCVENVSYDLDCADIGFQVRVIGFDRHRFDRDNDGFGCESY